MSENSGSMWMLTSGSYSDYSVHGIYTDQAEAEAAAAAANLGRNAYDTDYEVEVVAVLDRIVPRRISLVSVTGYPLKEGQPGEVSIGTRVVFDQQDVATSVSYDELTGRLNVFGEPEVARKVYSERAARIKADAEGITR